MLNIHFRQTKRRYQPEGPEHVEGWVSIMDPRLSPGGLLECDSSVPDADDFKTVGNWREVIRLAINRQESKRVFFTMEGVPEQLPAAPKLAMKAGNLVRVLTDLLKETPDDDVEYSESNEIYTVDYWSAGDIDYEGD